MSEQERNEEQLNNQENETTRTDSMASIDDLLENPFDTPQSMPELEIQTQDSEQEQRQAGKTYEYLPAEQQEQARKLAEQIDITDTDSGFNYRSAAQQNIGDFSHNVWNHVQKQETGTIGNAINDLMFQLEESNPDELVQENQNFIQRLFKRAKRSIYETTAKYQKIGAQVDKIALQLDKQKSMLLEDNKMLTQRYE